MNTITRVVALLLACIGLCQAIDIGKGLVRIDDQNFGLFQTNIPVNLTDSKISFGFTLLTDKSDPESFVTPEHVVLALSVPELSSELYVYPKLLQGKVYEANLILRDVSPFVLSSEQIQITVITGDQKETSYAATIDAGTLKPSEKLRADRNTVAKPRRFTERDELFFSFREKPKNLPSLISTQFSFLLLILVVVLILAWNYFDAANASNLTKYSPLSFLFLASIFVFEYYFVEYYLGASIFQSLYRFAITGLFAIYFGSKTLRDMYKLRMAKLR